MTLRALATGVRVRRRRKVGAELGLGGSVILSLLLWLLGSSRLGGAPLLRLVRAAPPQPPQMATDDRLAVPVLPESPTQVDLGRNLYYFHCMPCHGDRGQGLTDEWRQVWVEDHQNCWGRGCHTGRSELDAFYIPRAVPPVTGSAQALGLFETPGDLFTFLRETQPPQRPGALADSEYWALTTFLLHENGRLATDAWLGSAPGDGPGPQGDMVAAFTLAALLALLVVPWLGRLLGQGSPGTTT